MIKIEHRLNAGCSSHRQRARAFTLTELLVVIAIIAMIVTLVVPVTSSMMSSSRLNAGISQVVGGLNTARQTAIAHNHTVEVRFYKFADVDTPGETIGDQNTWAFHAFQAFEYLDNGAPIPLGKVEMLPTGIICDRGGISSILADSTRVKYFYPNRPPGSLRDPNPADTKVPLPVVGANYDCYYFQFMPSGMTELGVPANKWYITVHRAADGDNRDLKKGPPPNYGTVQLDSISGATRVYRPGL